NLLLPEGVIDGHGWARHYIFIINIGCHPDDAARPGTDVDKFYDRIGPHYVAVHGLLVGEHVLGQALADDDHEFAAAAISIVEIASGDDGDAERAEKSRRY